MAHIGWNKSPAMFELYVTKVQDKCGLNMQTLLVTLLTGINKEARQTFNRKPRVDEICTESMTVIQNTSYCLKMWMLVYIHY